MAFLFTAIYAIVFKINGETLLRGIVWFREDLRIHDNTALANAAKHCTDGIIALYIIDIPMLKKHHMANCRIDFILRGLSLLKNDLEALHIPFTILKLTKSDSITANIIKLVHQSQAEALFFNRQYETNEIKRDSQVQTYLNKHSIACYSFDDTVILPPHSLITQQGSYFKVFTPFKNAWYKKFLADEHRLLPALKPQKPIPFKSSDITFELNEFRSTIDPNLWPSGERSAKRKLNTFIKHHLFSYDKNRDFPANDGTSKLSPYLSAGMISPRACFLKAFDANQQELNTGNKGVIAWMIELIWRDFYKHLLVFEPKLSMHRAFQAETEKIIWAYDEKKFIAWQTGNTGIPIVDAAMRQLNTTGWMHNRLRMIVAMFFSKNLFFDWRLGEDYFIRHLIDGDLAANNGGWQWSASTGTDAAPYFRIFNPIRQSERFDPEGIFIRKYCPELNDFDNHAIHAPFDRMPLLAKNTSYPKPIVNLELSRKHAIAAFAKLRH